MAFSLVFALLFGLGGGGDISGDLLDFAPTEGYWQMRDQRIVNIETMMAVLEDDKATPTDKLMSIRALGELGKGEKVDPADKVKVVKKLTALVQSKEPFVGQYAKRSIAWIKGEDPESRPLPSADLLASDLALLPAESVVVAQLTVDNGVGPSDLGKIIPDLNVPNAGFDREEMIKEATSGVLQAVQMVGNARIDALSLGVVFLGNEMDNGYFMLVGRGQYDRIGAQLAIEQLVKGEGEEDNFNFYSIDDTEVIAGKNGNEQVVMLLPSDELFVVVFGEPGKDTPLPIAEVAKRLNEGGKATFSETITAQIEQIDRSKANGWMVMQVTPAMKTERDLAEVIGPFESARMVSTTGEKGEMILDWHAQGSNADAVAKTVDFLNKQLEEGRKEMREEMKRMPEMKQMFEPMVKIMDSIKIEADGKTMTGGLTVTDGLGTMMMMPFMMFMAF